MSGSFPPGGATEERIFPAMPISNWKVAVVSLCGLGVCVAGYGGLAQRLSPHAPSAPRELSPAVSEAEEDAVEEIPPLPEWVEAEA